MKSNQERSNECLPPKKREIPAPSRAQEEKAAAGGSGSNSGGSVLPPSSDNHRAEAVPWLSGPSGGARGHSGSNINSNNHSNGRHGASTAAAAELGLQPGMGIHKGLSGLDYSPPSAPRSVPTAAATSTLPTAYPPSGTPVSPVQYAHLPHTFQFIGSSQYSGPYAGFIPSQLISPTASPATSSSVASSGVATPSQRSQLEAYSTLLASMGSLSHKAEPPPPPPPPPSHLGRTPPGLVAAGSPPTTPS